MISRTPRRSGKTPLSDDELIILDALFDGARPLGTLYREKFSEIHNLPYRHDLSRNEVTETVRKLELQGILHSEEGQSRGTYFSLTEEGGRLWEREREPDWTCFVAVDGQLDSNGNRTTMIARSQSLVVAQAYLETLEACGHTPVILESRTAKMVEIARVLPWKSLEQVHEVHALIGRAAEEEPKIDWKLYQDRRIWWTTVSELQDFPPAIAIRISPGAGDLELVAEVRALEGKLDRVNEVDLRGMTAGCFPDFEGTGVTDQGLQVLERMPRLASLWIEKAPITDRSLEVIGRLTILENLLLGEVPITDDGVARLAGLSMLRFLDLPGAEITDRALEFIARLAKLRRLNLSNTKIQGHGLQALESLKYLEELFLEGTGISDISLVPLAGLARLTHLDLGATRIGDPGLAHVSRLTGLNGLNLGQTEVTNEGLRFLAGMRDLEDLWLDHTSVGDSGLAHLAGLRMMRTLFLHNTNVTDVGLRFFRGMRNLYSLHLDDTAVTDAGLEHLGGLHLSHIELSGTRVTSAGIERLQRAMPRLQID
jgi:predicted transcriptional regulator